MKRFISRAAALLFIIVLPLRAVAAEYLVPVGQIIGLQLRCAAVTVAAFDDALGARTREAGLQIGDEIIAVEGRKITAAEDVLQAIRDRERIRMTVRRGSRTVQLTLPVQQTSDGQRLGIYLRQGIAGVGTVTWYDPRSGRFGALGHGVSDSGGELLAMTGGTAYEAQIETVKKGRSGTPGQLRGLAREENPIGQLEKNTPQGVFGTARAPWTGKALPTARYEEVCTGPASIRSCVGSEGPREYSVEILKIYPKDRPDCRNYLLRVTDPTLLEITGGIVQGMSGSPIIQNGKLIGAVTHVLVNDPTTGYGIFIENMLDAAG